MTVDQYVQKLIELSEKKLDSLKEIFNLTKQQSGVISEDNVEEINRLIELKQKQIDNIDELDSSFEVYYSRLKSVVGVDSIEELRMSQISGAAELKQLITVIFDTAKKIQTLEIDNKTRVEAIVNKLAEDIKKIKQSKAVNNGYNMGAKLPPQSYFDQKK